MLRKVYHREMTAATFVGFMDYMHQFYRERDRLPKYVEVPHLYQKVWLHNDATTGQLNGDILVCRVHHIKKWLLGIQLECEIYKFLQEQAVDVYYDAQLDVRKGVDLMVRLRPVQIKSSSYFQGMDGMHYLVVTDYHGTLTSQHKQMIMGFVRSLNQ